MPHALVDECLELLAAPRLDWGLGHSRLDIARWFWCRLVHVQADTGPEHAVLPERVGALAQGAHARDSPVTAPYPPRPAGRSGSVSSPCDRPHFFNTPLLWNLVQKKYQSGTPGSRNGLRYPHSRNSSTASNRTRVPSNCGARGHTTAAPAHSE